MSIKLRFGVWLFILAISAAIFASPRLYDPPKPKPSVTIFGDARLLDAAIAEYESGQRAKWEDLAPYFRDIIPYRKQNARDETPGTHDMWGYPLEARVKYAPDSLENYR